MNILEEIAGKRQIDIENRKSRISPERMKERAQKLAEEELREKGEFSFPFEKNLMGEGIHFICEVKKASPSKGLIAEDFPYLQIAKEYEQAGAAAISVLTEPEYFLGKDEYLQKITEKVSVPVLRKDFTIDTYQIYEARLLGASAVLLICSLLSPKQLKEFLEVAHGLGLSALVEAHDEEEVKQALEAGARIVGVNNRDLKTFEVDISNSIRLRRLVPRKILFVSESGIRTAEDIRKLKENGTNGVLIGETLMRSGNKKDILEELKNA
ncbi:MAG: indole-3-glycerol phosphate synthase TrpC [Lachnospiraceae bacterium]